MRRTDWLERLWATLEAKEPRPFHYGACVALAAECVDAIRGSHFREDVTPLIEAAKVRPIALQELQALVTERLGEPIKMDSACPGDAVLLNFPPPMGPALGICIGNQVACPAVPVGIGLLRRRHGLCAWRVSA